MVFLITDTSWFGFVITVFEQLWFCLIISALEWLWFCLITNLHTFVYIVYTYRPVTSAESQPSESRETI